MERLLFIHVSGYEVVLVLELVDGEWVKADVEEYDDTFDDLILTATEEGYVWTGVNGFTKPAIGEVGEPPAPDHANSLFQLFAAHAAQVYADDPYNEPVESVAFIYVVPDEDES